MLNPRQIFEGVRSDVPVVVAVSGGSDSVAMLNLAAAWASVVGADLRVVTVDHGLRPEAAAEAAFVAGLCEGLGLPHFTLAWEGMKPAAGISEAARQARYLLMEEFAKDIGAEEILVAHTSDDQAETLWMRNSRDGKNPQWRGLAGMARTMLLPSGLKVHRPLLDASRDALRQYLAAIGQVWIEDPSNMDRSFERVRVRQHLAKTDIAKEDICRFAALSGRYRKLVAKTVSDILVDELVVENGPVFSIDARFMANQPNDHAAILIAQVLVAIAGGREHFVPHDVASKILALERGERISSGYAIVERHKSVFRFYRESRNLEATHVAPFSQVLWDNRILIDNSTDRSYLCSAMDRGQLKEIETELGIRMDVRPRAALHASPVLTRENGVHFIPFVQGFNRDIGLRLTFRVPAIEYFCSEHDFPLLEIVEHVRNELHAEQSPPEIRN
ncbi:MAG: tRNA lysidine(34) synthetase TilS [Pseudomonadota bacterium]